MRHHKYFYIVITSLYEYHNLPTEALSAHCSSAVNVLSCYSTVITASTVWCVYHRAHHAHHECSDDGQHTEHPHICASIYAFTSNFSGYKILHETSMTMRNVSCNVTENAEHLLSSVHQKINFSRWENGNMKSILDHHRRIQCTTRYDYRLSIYNTKTHHQHRICILSYMADRLALCDHFPRQYHRNKHPDKTHWYIYHCSKKAEERDNRCARKAVCSYAHE